MPAKKTKAQPPYCAECATNPVTTPGDRCDTCQVEEPRIIHELVLRRMEQLGLAVQDDAVDSFNETIFAYLESHDDPELASKVRTSKYPDAPFTKHALVWWFRENKIDTVWWPSFATWLGIPDPVEFFTFMGHVRLRDWPRAAMLRDRWFASREPSGDQRARYQRLIEALETTMTEVARATSDVVRLRAEAVGLAREQGLDIGDNGNGTRNDVGVPSDN